jgi:hypothetical protein
VQFSGQNGQDKTRERTNTRQTQDYTNTKHKTTQTHEKNKISYLVSSSLLPRSSSEDETCLDEKPGKKWHVTRQEKGQEQDKTALPRAPAAAATHLLINMPNKETRQCTT